MDDDAIAGGGVATTDDGLAQALSDALTVYAADAPLSEACAPLISLVEALCPPWAAGLVQIHGGAAGLGRFDNSFVCDPGLSARAAEHVRAAITPETALGPPHELVFDTIAVPDAPRVALARLLISDDHAVGVLVLVWRGEGSQGGLPEVTPTLQIVGRLLALMLEDRQAISALSQREAVLRSVLETAPDAIIRIDSSGVICGFNRAAERVFGYSAHEAVDQPVSLLMKPDHAARHQGFIDQYLRTGKRRMDTARRRFPAVGKDGVELTIELAIGDLTVQGERQFIGVIRDVTALLREEERQSHLNQTIEHAAQLSALGEMAATIAHEVNQPLTAIANFLDAAANLTGSAAVADQARLTDYIGQARDQARIGGDIIKRVRRLTMRRAPEREDLDLNAVTRDVIGYLERLAKAEGATLRMELGDPSPHVHADRVQVQQVIANLVRNAIDAVAGAPTRVVTVGTLSAPQGGELRISDTGPGVPSDKRDVIFESFFTTRADGVGLGLSVSRSIMEAHGGSLTVGDAEGGGACFRAFLPMAAP